MLPSLLNAVCRTGVVHLLCDRTVYLKDITMQETFNTFMVLCRLNHWLHQSTKAVYISAIHTYSVTQLFHRLFLPSEPHILFSSSLSAISDCISDFLLLTIFCFSFINLLNFILMLCGRLRWYSSAYDSTLNNDISILYCTLHYVLQTNQNYLSRTTKTIHAQNWNCN